MLSTSSIAGGGGGAAPSVGGVAGVPLAELESPTHYTYKGVDCKMRSVSLCGFNPNTVLVLRADGGKLSRDVEDILSKTGVPLKCHDKPAK